MRLTKFALTPYYEPLDDVIPLQRIFVNDDTPVDPNGRYICNEKVAFEINYDQSFLLNQSKRDKSADFNIKVIIRFCKAGEIQNTVNESFLKDSFPLHLQLELNNASIPLPNFLPNDKCGKDGRRFPRPVDITEGLNDNLAIENKLHIHWVQGDNQDDEYYFGIYLVRLRSWEELTRIIVSHNISTVSTTLKLVSDQCCVLGGTAEESSYASTSLNCPVLRARMAIPFRGKNCDHLQCFDGMTYLMMNFMKPTWLCPVCDRYTIYSHLEVDGLLYNIIKDERSKVAEDLEFNSSGHWRPALKVIGQTSEEQPFYDITEYMRQSVPNIMIKPPPSSVPNPSNIKVEKSSEDPPLSTHTISLMPNHTQLLPALSNPPDHHTSFGTTNYPLYVHNQSTPSVAATPTRLTNLSDSISHQTRPHTNETSTVQPSMGFYFDNVPHGSSTTPMTLRITDVKSMAPQHIDPAVDRSGDMKDGVIKLEKDFDTSKSTHKRPTMVSSAPSEASASKQMRVDANGSADQTKPRSASVTDTRVQEQVAHMYQFNGGRIYPDNMGSSPALPYTPEYNQMMMSAHSPMQSIQHISSQYMPQTQYTQPMIQSQYYNDPNFIKKQQIQDSIMKSCLSSGVSVPTSIQASDQRLSWSNFPQNMNLRTQSYQPQPGIQGYAPYQSQPNSQGTPLYPYMTGFQPLPPFPQQTVTKGEPVFPHQTSLQNTLSYQPKSADKGTPSYQPQTNYQGTLPFPRQPIMHQASHMVNGYPAPQGYSASLQQSLRNGTAVAMPNGQPLMQYPASSHAAILPPRFYNNSEAIPAQTYRNTSMDTSPYTGLQQSGAILNHGFLNQSMPQYTSSAHPGHLNTTIDGTNNTHNTQQVSRMKSATTSSIPHGYQGGIPPKRRGKAAAKVQPNGIDPRQHTTTQPPHKDVSKHNTHSSQPTDALLQRNSQVETMLERLQNQVPSLDPCAHQRGYPKSHTTAVYPLSEKQWLQMMQSYPAMFQNPDAMYHSPSSDYLPSNSASPFSSNNSYSNLF